MIKVNQHPFETQKIITSDLYKGSIIEKAYGGGDEGLISAELIRVQLNNKLEKGIISEELHAKAMEQLDSLLEKGGEGSKGGKVIGHTKSGKPVYAGKSADHKDHKDFSAQDHLDAAKLHGDKSKTHSAEAYNSGKYGDYASALSAKNVALAAHHSKAGAGHAVMADKKEDEARTKWHAAQADDTRITHGEKIKEGRDLKKAYDTLGIEYKETDSLEKASKGEGSKGGHVIGHTRSGKPVYDTKHAGRDHYKEFTPEEHEDAAMIHRKRSEEHGEKASKGHSAYAKTHHSGMREWHDDTAKSHEHHADKKRKATASPDEKKIIADQKKKKLDHHNRMSDFHKTMLDSIKKYKEDKSTGYGSQATQDAIQEAEHHHQKQFEHHDEQAIAHALDATIALSKEKGTLGQFRGPK